MASTRPRPPMRPAVGGDPWATPIRARLFTTQPGMTAWDREREEREERALHEAARDDHEHDWRTR